MMFTIILYFEPKLNVLLQQCWCSVLLQEAHLQIGIAGYSYLGHMSSQGNKNDVTKCNNSTPVNEHNLHNTTLLKAAVNVQ